MTNTEKKEVEILELKKEVVRLKKEISKLTNKIRVDAGIGSIGCIIGFHEEDIPTI